MTFLIEFQIFLLFKPCLFYYTQSRVQLPTPGFYLQKVISIQLV
jgi:hypothetical protein